MKTHTDTICARATPPGTGAIAIVRLSGPQAIAIVDRCFRPHSSAQSLPQARSHSLIFGHLHDPETAEPIDDILVAIMRGPHSYTGEDVVEVNLHGSPAIVRRTLRTFAGLGARLAEPGEFTRRAFENGQIDLAQAEAICDLITAQTQAAAAIALRQLEGQLTERIARTREHLVDLLAQIEAHLDFPDEDLGEEEGDRWLLMIHSAGDEIARLIAGGERGQLLREGARVVLAGKPNAGKSSLFNRLLGQERAIVSEHPGTTRDSLESLVEIAGLPLTVIDTAGLRAAAGEIERLGIVRTEKEIHQASLVLVCLPANEPWSEKDDAVWHLVADSNPIIALTKSDLPTVLTPEMINGRTGATVIPTSAVTGEGIEELVATIGHRLLEQTEPEEAGDPLIASERHLTTLRLGLNSLSAALRAFSDPPALELVAADLREAITALDQILGLQLGDDILDRIFARFCIGK